MWDAAELLIVDSQLQNLMSLCGKRAQPAGVLKNA
jgi:hypothetical protein